MKRRNATRNALFMSIISLMLCVSMLVGTTFAWFTDSVESGRNVIAAGNLDVELFHDDKETKDYTKVDGNTTLFDDVKPNLWEPGAVAYENLQVKNVGTLALKYNLDLTVLEETEVNGHKLSEVIKVGIVKGGVKSTDRDAVIKEVTTWTALADFSLSMNGMELAAKTDAEAFGIVLYWQPNDNEIDNLYNLNNGQEGTLKLDIGVNLYATQLEAESDSFGNDYDEDADLGNVWNPEDDATVPDPEENEDGTKVLTINTAGELAAFAEAVNGGNTYAGVTVVLNSDINLNNHAWTPIGQTGPTQFAGTFDGNGKTIYNLNIDNTANTSEHGAAGLFGWVEQHSGSNSIKNLTINGVTINSHRYSGAIAGWINIPVTNCTVKNVTINCSYYNDATDGTKVGALVGYADNNSALTGNTVDTAILNAYGDVGGLAGVAQTTVSVDGNTVKNVKINYNSDVKSVPGEIVSTRVAPVMGTNTADNVTITHVIATQADFEAAVAAGKTDIVLAAGEFTADLYNITDRDSLTITGQGADTKLAFSNLQVRASQFKNLTISNCTIERMPDKAWGHLVFGSSDNADGVYTISNCIFNGVGSQGIYINENTNGVTYNIENCVFNGDFGNEGAITIQNNADVNVNVKVNGCTFNNIPETSHDIYVHYENKGLNLTVDGKVTVANATMLADAVSKGATDIYLMDGEYDVKDCAGKTLTINGSKDAVIKLYNDGEDGCDYAFGGNGTGVGDVTFNGVTIDTTENNGNYKGFAYMKGTFNDCNFVGAYSLNNANDFVFNRCTFDFKNGYFWTWGANSVTFDGCIFNGNSKAILAHGYASTVINIKDCVFAATEQGFTGSGDNTAAVEIDPAGSNTYTINFTGENTINENYAGWTRVKDDSTGHTITGLN